MSSAPRPSAPVWAAPHPTAPTAAVLRLHRPTDGGADARSGRGRECGDPEAVLTRAARRKARIRIRRLVAGATRSTGDDPRELDRWEDEGGSPRGVESRRDA